MVCCLGLRLSIQIPAKVCNLSSLHNFLIRNLFPGFPFQFDKYILVQTLQMKLWNMFSIKKNWIQHNLISKEFVSEERRIFFGLLVRNVPNAWHNETNSRCCFAVSLKLQTLLQGYKRLIRQSVILKPFSLPQRCFWELF